MTARQAENKSAVKIGKKHPRVRLLRVDDLNWELAPAPWPNSRPVVEVALDALRVIEDELARRVIAQLASTIVDQNEELAAVRAVSSASLTFSAAQLGQATNARRRLGERLAEERRCSR
jgi:hypothetical protein